MELIISVLKIVMGMVTGVVAVNFILIFTKSHRLRIRDPMNKAKYIEDRWVMEKIDKETGVLSWVNIPFAKKLTTPRPPDQAIEIGKRGRKFAEAYRLSEDQFCWITDKGVTIQERENETTKRIEQVIVDETKDGNFRYIDTFKPFSSTQREALVNQFKKAAEISKNRWTPDKIIMASSLGMLFILIMMVVVFWGDLAAPLIDMQSVTGGMVQQVDKITRNQAIIMENLGADISDLDLDIVQTPKTQAKLPPLDPLLDPLALYRK